ncbi:hypothetical protein [Variovorax sp. Sphag1AA]|uniref:single-stranded DNA-binding protein n=1 Tax=Variovorax sp. Sphag1AA TaxID=2587027 RepID=UPI0016086B3E|nr:hypothetical protein [Variovorax sp. Sphag1AA]MBB3180092.1 single-stranded DNA-binding protein [Variovorax sp. Sphag1AA]
MSIAALVTGKLADNPERRVGPSGKSFALGHLIADDGEHVHRVTLFAFRESAQEVLLALGTGAALSASGALKLSTWTPKDGGEPRVQASMVVDALLTLHERAQVDRAVRRARDASKQRGSIERSHRETRAIWHGNGGASGFDDLQDDEP